MSTQPLVNLQQISAETIEKAKEAFQINNRTVPIIPGLDVSKAIGVTTALALTGYDLSGPAQTLVPLITPLRNRFPRRPGNVGSAAFHKVQITGINTAQIKGSVAFGARNTGITYTTVPKSWSYKSIGMDDLVQFEAFWQGQGFEDLRARSAMTTLWSTMIQEEALLLGANSSLTLTQGTVTLDVSAGTGVTDGTGVRVYVIPLTLHGYKFRGVNTSGVAIGIFYNKYKGASAHADSGAISNKQVKATWAAVPGAVAYAVFTGQQGVGPYYLQAVVTTNEWDSGTAALSVSGQYTLATSLAAGTPYLTGIFSEITDADQSTDSNDFDGLMTQIETSGSGSYILDMDNVALTADNAGGVSQLDTMFKWFWDNRKVGPTALVMNAQEALNITNKITGGTGSVVGQRVMLQQGDQKELVGGFFVKGYTNKFTSSLTTPGAPDVVPFMIHPDMPPGRIVCLTERLPFPKNDIENPIEVRTLQEYADFEWALTQRQYEHGVYCHQTLVCYFTAGLGVIRNIKNA